MSELKLVNDSSLKLIDMNEASRLLGIKKSTLYDLECLDTLKTTPSCIYFLCDGKKILYVGQSKNLYQRLFQHIESGKRFNRILYFYVQPNELDSVELKLIKALKPPLNIAGK